MTGADAYDAIYMLAIAIAKVKSEGKEVTDGAALMAAIRETDFVGVTGRLYSASGQGADVSQQNDRLGQTSYFVLSNVRDTAPTIFTPIGQVNETHVDLTQQPQFSGGVTALAVSCSAGTIAVVTAGTQTYVRSFETCIVIPTDD